MKKIVSIVFLIILLNATLIASSNAVRKKEFDKGFRNHFYSHYDDFGTSDNKMESCPVIPPPPRSIELNGEGDEQKSHFIVDFPVLTYKLLNIFNIFYRIFSGKYYKNGYNNIANDALVTKKEIYNTLNIFQNGSPLNCLELSGDGNYGKIKAFSQDETYAKVNEFTLRNIGNRTVSGYVYLQGYHKFHIIQGGGDFTLDIGQSMIIKVMFWPKSDGIYSGTLYADQYGNRNEEGPDLEIISLEPFDKVIGYNVRWIIKNSGYGTSYVSGRDMISNYFTCVLNGKKLKDYNSIVCAADYPDNCEGVLEPGNTIEGCTYCVGGAMPGTLYTVKVDPFNFVPEINENNNEITIRLPFT